MFTRVHRLGPFIDQHPTLCALLDDPRISGAFASVLGDDFTYWGSDGNFFAGNTGCEPPHLFSAFLLPSCPLAHRARAA